VLEDHGPTIFVENKQLYAQRPATAPPLDLKAVELDRNYDDYPPLAYGPADDGSADVTIVTYGGLTATVEAAMRRMIEEQELRFDYFILTQLWPQRLDGVVQSAARTGRLVVVEEAAAEFGVGSAVISEVAQQVRGIACRVVGATSACIPAVRHLEDRVLPSVDRVVAAICQVA
jgi:pyruvate/2-oxoglutarate/acetoin dehydrogenase E1 component